LKIWFEALTGKQSLLFHYLAKGLESDGHEILFTARENDYTRSNLQRLNREFISIGTHGGANLKQKLIAGSERIIKLAEIVDDFKPDLLITFGSPDATRTAFGLGIKTIQLNDTPHARAVAKLTISLSNYVIHPKCIPEGEFSKNGISNFYGYDGVDEVLWVKQFEPDESVIYNLGLEKFNYVVLRCEETNAAYMRRLYPHIPPDSTFLVEFIPKLMHLYPDLKFVVFPRYPKQKEDLKKLNIIIPDQSVDTLNLLHFAKASLTGGGTMGRESALLGTPSMYTFPLEVDVSRFVRDLGFPLVHVSNPIDILNEFCKVLNQEKMNEENRLKILNTIETPLNAVRTILKKLKEELK